jgi:hypothetical protein
MEMAKKFRRFLQTYRKSDGSSWTGADLERATRGEASRFYVSHFRRGLIKDPSFAKTVAIGRATGIPLEAWLEDSVGPADNGTPRSRLQR